MKRYAYIGCRTTRERDACGNGIEVYQVNDITGGWQHMGTVKTLENPSYLAFDKEGQYLYAVHGDTTKASAFYLEPGTGMPQAINSVELKGSNPVFLLPDHTNQDMLIACLGSGNIVAVQRREDGGLGGVDAQYMFPGNEDVQKMTCPHQIYYDMDEKYL
ncbi:MAG: beta-propeller fold lactonase family protein, partial [Clostridium sp.]|nr:beta-propeller fold lactonase family protein [Clostridium sp.]